MISRLAKNLAKQFLSIPDAGEWKIGCHLIIYRDGNDSISWHADETQGESCILSQTIDGPNNASLVCFQPHKEIRLKNGDEQLELFPIAGDGYCMDDRIQLGYVHAILKTRRNEKGKHMAIIF